jgi:hypothetical protein
MLIERHEMRLSLPIRFSGAKPLLSRVKERLKEKTRKSGNTGRVWAIPRPTDDSRGSRSASNRSVAPAYKQFCPIGKRAWLQDQKSRAQMGSAQTFHFAPANMNESLTLTMQ